LQRTDEPAVPDLLPACHHATFTVAEDGSFTAQEEVRLGGKTFLAEDINGKFDDYVVDATFFGDKITVQMEVLDTDYENFMIGYECYDNMQYTLANAMEPVHIITVGIATRAPDTPAE